MILPPFRFLLAIPPAIILAFGSIPCAAVEDATDPVGFYVLDAESGLNLLTPGLVSREEFTGKLTSILASPSDSVFTVTNAGWNVGAFNTLNGFPTHYVEILDEAHPAQGLVVDIIENQSEQLTVALDAATLVAYGFTGNEQIRIRAHTTLQSFFENTALSAFSDEVKLFRPEGVLRFIHNGVNWIKSDTFFNANGQVIYPGEAFSFRTSAPSKNIVVGGNTVAYVKTTPTLVNIYGGGLSNYIGQVNPLVGRNGLIGDIDFANSLTTPFADSMKLFYNSGSGSGLEVVARYVFNGSELVDAGTFQPASTDPLPYSYALWVRTRDDLTILLPPGF